MVWDELGVLFRDTRWTKGLVESNWKRLGQGKVRKKGRVIGVG